MIEMDRNDPVVNTGRSSEEDDLVGSRQRKWPEQDRAEIENEENDWPRSLVLKFDLFGLFFQPEQCFSLTTIQPKIVFFSQFQPKFRPANGAS